MCLNIVSQTILRVLVVLLMALVIIFCSCCSSCSVVSVRLMRRSVVIMLSCVSLCLVVRFWMCISSACFWFVILATSSVVGLRPKDSFKWRSVMKSVSLCVRM